MDTSFSLLYNIILGAICIWFIVTSFLSKDKTKIWSPITFLSLSYLYYCVIPLFETDKYLLGVSSIPYLGLFHFAALLSFISILFGFYKVKICPKLSKYKWESCFNESNYKFISVFLFILAIVCYVSCRGFRFNIIVYDDEILEFDWDNQGLNYYLVASIALFVTSCCLLLTHIKTNKILFGIICWFTLVIYIITGFRYRIVILVISLFTTYHLFNKKSHKIRILPVIIIGLFFYIVFNVMDVSRSYSNGIRYDAVASLSSEDLLKKASETDRVYNFSVLTIGKYNEAGRMDYFAPLINAFFMPIPRVFFPWKPRGEYIYEAQSFVMGGRPGSACVGFAEAFMAFGWIGIILNGIFIGWLSRLFWVYYKKYPNSIGAILALAIFNGFTYVIVSRGYLAQQFSIFLFFVCLPFVLARIVKHFYHG